MIALGGMKNNPGPREAVKHLGEAIGFGNMMRLAEELWIEALDRQGGGGGGAYSVGPCVAELVPCPCSDRVACEWCCGAGRVTARVASAMEHERGAAIAPGADAAAGATITIDGKIARGFRPRRVQGAAPGSSAPAVWHEVAADTAFAPPFGTIRKCIDCGALVAGGPTRCGRCARDGGAVAGTGAAPAPPHETECAIHIPGGECSCPASPTWPHSR
jgi:hypothetical protein